MCIEERRNSEVLYENIYMLLQQQYHKRSWMIRTVMNTLLVAERIFSQNPLQLEGLWCLKSARFLESSQSSSHHTLFARAATLHGGCVASWPVRNLPSQLNAKLLLLPLSTFHFFYYNYNRSRGVWVKGCLSCSVQVGWLPCRPVLLWVPAWSHRKSPCRCHSSPWPPVSPGTSPSNPRFVGRLIRTTLPSIWGRSARHAIASYVSLNDDVMKQSYVTNVRGQ